MTIETRLRAIFDTVFELDPSVPDDSLSYQLTPRWDSLGAVLLIAAIEDDFNVEIGTAKALSIDSFSSAVATLRELGVTD